MPAFRFQILARLGPVICQPDSRLWHEIQAWKALRLARAQAAFVRRKSDTVIIEAEKALALNPNSPTLGGIAGLLIGYSGQLEKGVEIVEGMKQLNPHYPSWMLSLTCFADYMKGNYEAALADAEQVTLNRFSLVITI